MASDNAFSSSSVASNWRRMCERKAALADEMKLAASYLVTPASLATCPPERGTDIVAKPSVLVSWAGPAHAEKGARWWPPRKLIPAAACSAAQDVWPSRRRTAPFQARLVSRLGPVIDR